MFTEKSIAAPKEHATLEGPVRPRTAQKKSWRKRLFRGLLITGIVLLLLLALLTAGGIYFVSRTLPQVGGTLTVSGLHAPVGVTRDTYGVPAIRATDMHDALFAQGYVTAQDRLFQMEVNRRTAEGRLSEMFGAGPGDNLLDSDEFLNTLNFYGAAQKEWDGLDADSRMQLQAYASGVNAFISTHMSSLPVEFTILGITPRPWTPIDSLAYARVLALALDTSWFTKYTRALILMQKGPAIVQQLYPPYPASSPTLIGGSGQANALSGLSTTSIPVTGTANAAAATLSASLRGAATVQQLLSGIGETLGSNNWVVDGTKTTTGKPLLANDPHLQISMPGIWYEVSLQGGALHATGFSLPGAPGVLLGHNDSIAWGITNVGADDTDLYRETVDPVHHPGQYLYNNEWLPLQVRRVTIPVRGAPAHVITVTSTLHGPIMNSTMIDLKNVAPLSLEWTALQPEYTFRGFFQIDFAQNWSQFRSVLGQISLPQNFVYADTAGNIGYQMSGLLPLRPAANRLLPVDGNDPRYDWHGYVSQGSLPTLFNPPTHIIVTANNQIVSPGYPVYIASIWDQGYRAQHIEQLLSAPKKLSVEDFEHIQTDQYSIPAADLAPVFSAVGAAGNADARAAAQLLKNWNYTMDQNSAAAALFEVTMSMLAHNLIEPVLGQTLYTTYHENYSFSGLFSVIINLVNDPVTPFVQGKSQIQRERALDQQIVRALDQSMQFLRSQMGNNPGQWAWGKVHQIHFAHPLTNVPILKWMFDVPAVGQPGDGVTIGVGGDEDFSNIPPDFAQWSLSSMRMIVDMAQFDRSAWIIPVGESGQPFSAHYQDLLPLWSQGKYQSMNFSSAALQKAAVTTLRLQPAGKR